MKKTFLIPILAIFLIATTANAQVSNLPSAGITPDSPFYFLDIWGEHIQEFFTFNPESKAKLQIKFAGERISEIKEMVKKDGAKAKGIQEAKTLLLGNVATAAKIIQNEKTSGKDVTKLAKTIDDSFNAQEKLLTQTFQDARKKLKNDRVTLKQKLTGVKSIQSTKVDSNKDNIDTQIKSINKDMGDLKGMQDNLDNLFGTQQSKIKKQLSPKDREADKKEMEKTDKKEKAIDTEIESESENENSVNTSDGMSNNTSVKRGKYSVGGGRSSNEGGGDGGGERGGEGQESD